jgi:hypothetical protein
LGEFDDRRRKYRRCGRYNEHTYRRNHQRHWEYLDRRDHRRNDVGKRWNVKYQRCHERLLGS